MSQHSFMRRRISTLSRQRGVVLFIALIALVTIMLAAVALVRSVDTSSLIAGNIAFRRAATSSGDTGLESAIAWLSAEQIKDQAKLPADQALNNTSGTNGYYSNLSDMDFFSAARWADQLSASAGKDASGNDVRYIIERMCSTIEGEAPIAEKCVFSDAESQTDSMDTSKQHAEKSGSSVMFRVTVRVTGPRNTVSYVQGFIY
ncbi:Putative Tfp pilus assembly protein PilX [Herminiimonas arsenicoxydans]|uniref:Tfp pilus assembly protein PilX n=1 Tax=Herminiimonas arsenicoxydans TaxID=204773 RepID=A4G9N5_HERAR|nr:Putative Tfp pilus assembly protein PilX [Herminiimonas arsenicoxydans]